MQATVQRYPADKQGVNIVDPLLTSHAVAIARGRREVDYNCSNRDKPSCQCPVLARIPTGSLVRVIEEFGERAGLCRYRSQTFTITENGEQYTANTRLTVEFEK